MTLTSPIFITVCLWVAIILGYIIYNLYRKNKKQEDMLIKQSQYISTMLTLYNDYAQLADKVDSTMWVQSDPELLSLFDTIKQIKSVTEQFSK